MEEILKMVTRMDPEEAMAEMSKTLKALFSAWDDETRVTFLLDVIGESERDKVSSLVHL